MDKAVEITFQGIDKSDAIEARIAEGVAKLEKLFERMSYARVVVAAPHRHSRKGKVFQIKIEIGVPDHAPIVITHEPEINRTGESIKAAIRDAFNAAQRRLDNTVGRMSGTAKSERGRRRPAPAQKSDS
jgi:flavin-binding protein dodecin